MIYGERIRQAREICGLTQTQLAQRIGVKQPAIAQYESEQITPLQETLEAIAKETGFLPSFFEQEPIDFPLGSLCFRARNSLSKRERDQAYQCAKTMFEVILRVAPILRIPRPQLPIIQEKPITAAKVVRTAFGLSPDTPVKNLIRLLEKNGIIVITLPLFLRRLDAFSTWAKHKTERPIIILTSGNQSDRVRFSVAHELGHLVIHQPARGQLKKIEKEANEFAAEFLLPKDAMRNELVPPITLSRLAKLKLRWGTSMSFLIYRAKQLNIISERQKTYLYEQMSIRGWRKREPSNLDIPAETPVAYRKMIELAYEDMKQYANATHATLQRAQEFILFSGTN
jgi:Zn-dependent peptidase ImmA (M78 family)/transcriptional regulator with XRE-family HTH domain